MKPLSEVAPCLLVIQIQIQIQAVCRAIHFRSVNSSPNNFNNGSSTRRSGGNTENK